MAYDKDPELALEDGAILCVCPNPECPSEGKNVPFFSLTDGSDLWYCTDCLGEYNQRELKKRVGA